MPHAVYLIKAPSPSPDTARARLSSVEEDRMGDIVEPSGCQYAAYMANPVVLFDHGMDARIARRPVGTMLSLTTSATDITGTWRWSASAEGQDIQARWNAGDLNGVSIGFRPLRSVPRPNGGMHYQTWELVELSVVALPACASCLAVRSACQCQRGGSMRYDDEETVDLDEPLLRELIRAVARQQVAQFTGRLDASAGPRVAVTPLGRVPLDATVRPSRQASDEVVLELADEPPPSSRWEAWKRAGFGYREMERAWRSIDNSSITALRRQQAAQAGR